MGTLGCLNALMADDPPVENSTYWRNRAEEARTLAERMLDAYIKVLMLGHRKRLRTDRPQLRRDRQFHV